MLMPFVAISRLTNFNAGKSTFSQRFWLMCWLTMAVGGIEPFYRTAGRLLIYFLEPTRKYINYHKGSSEWYQPNKIELDKLIELSEHNVPKWLIRSLNWPYVNPDNNLAQPRVNQDGFSRWEHVGLESRFIHPIIEFLAHNRS